MKRFGLYIIILLYSALFLTGCRDTLVPPEDPPRGEAERTVIVYMLADNSLAGAVKGDTTEMAKVKNLVPKDVNFVIYLDDKAHKPAIYELSAKKGLRLWKQFDEELCSTDAETMLNTLQSIVQDFPARHYGLTLWSHATGWTPRRKTFGEDETPGPSQGEIEMEIPVLHDVLAQLPKFDYIFFDACFMQCIEVAYELRDVTDFIVGSPAEIPGPGAPYDRIVEALCLADMPGIVDGYDKGYPGTYNYYYYAGVLLSYIDCSQLDDLAEATRHFLIPLFMDRTEHNRSDYQYYCSSLNKYTYYFDMRTTMCRLLPQEDYDAWMEVFDRAVPMRTFSSTQMWYARLCYDPTLKDPSCYGGVSMFLPLNRYETYGWNAYFQKTSWYEALGWAETGW